MAIKRMSNPEMYGFAFSWSGEQRALFDHDSIRHMLPHVDAVVAGFEARKPPLVDPELRRLGRRAATLDPDHDALLGLGVDAIALLAIHARVRLKDPDRADAWIKVGKQLWPEGKAHNLKSYFEEGAHAVATGRWLAQHPEVRDFLATGLLADGDTLLKVVDDWVATGTELYQVEKQRRAREAQLAVPASSYLSARLTFIRLVNGLRTTLELDATVPAKTRSGLLDPLAQVEARADALRQKEGPDPEADPRGVDADVKAEG